MTDDELQRALGERRQELFNLRFQSATGALDNSARLRAAKREIARILTVRHERDSKLARGTEPRIAQGTGITNG
jgi:large subunit ribosomal protein L29